MPLKSRILTAAVLLLTGCSDSISEEEQEVLKYPEIYQDQKARDLPMSVRYHLYLYQYNLSFPHDIRFAGAVAFSGKPAAMMIMRDIDQKGYKRIASGLPVLFAMRDRGYYDVCMDKRYMTSLYEKVRKYSTYEAQRTALSEHVRALCEARK